MAAKIHLLHKERISSGDLKTSYVQFDEMETFEHTSRKPLSIALAVRPKTQEIIGAEVAEMNAKGHIAKESVEKYGLRIDTREDALKKVLTDVKTCSKKYDKTGLFTLKSDAKRAYITAVKEVLPEANYEQYKSRKDSDDLFIVNAIAGNIRQDMSRMSRQSRIMTRRKERLQAHLDLYIGFQNEYFSLVKPKRDVSLQEIKQICKTRYSFLEKNYRKMFKEFLSTLTNSMQNGAIKQRITCFTKLKNWLLLVHRIRIAIIGTEIVIVR
jgi:hypothetical protein